MARPLHRSPLLLALLAAAAGVTAWLAGAFGDGGGARLEEREDRSVLARDERQERGATVERSAPERSADEARSDGAPVRGAPATDSSPPASHPLSLRVLERDARRPLAGFALTLRQGETRLELATDLEGRLATPAVWGAGEVSVWHRPDPDRREYRAAWMLEPWQVEPGAEEHVLLARAPELVLEADALLSDGTGVAGAEVTLVYGWRDAAGGFHSEFVDDEETDASGRARFAVHRTEAWETSVYLVARQGERGLASALTFLDPPLTPGPWRLDLSPTGSARVRVFGRDGAPLPAGHVSATFAQTEKAAMTVTGARVEAGEARLEGLAPAPHRLRVSDPDTGDARRVVVGVASGREAQVEVRFDDGRTALAVEGRVVDEEGQPLGGVTVWYRAAGLGEGFDLTGDDGTFRFWSEPRAYVEVSTADALENDVYDPSAARVRFGTRDLVFRRARTVRRVSLAFEVAGPEGRPPEDGGYVQMWAGEPHAFWGWAWSDLSAGRARLEVALHRDLRYVVRCPGYVERTGAIAQPAEGEEPATVRLELERGFGWSGRVVDARTLEPIAGARLSEPGGELSGSTDGDGRARLSADAWPARLRVAREGYRERVIDPLDLELVRGRVELEPLDGGR